MAVATMHRSAYGLDHKGEDWRSRAICDTTWTDGQLLRPLGVSGGGRVFAPTILALRLAHVCREHCPVLMSCSRAATAHRPMGVVQAGTLWPGWHGQEPYRLADIGHGPWCKEATR